MQPICRTEQTNYLVAKIANVTRHVYVQRACIRHKTIFQRGSVHSVKQQTCAGYDHKVHSSTSQTQQQF